MKKPKLGTLVPLFLAFLAGCASLSSDKKDFFPTAGLENEKLSPRATPAQVTRETEEALKKKGFVAIGSISEKVVTGSYWGSTKLPEKPESRDVTTGLLRRAADRGGDLVALSKNNSAESNQVTKKGRALTWTKESRTVLYQRSLGSGKGSIQDSKTEYYSVPTSWETVYGTEYSVVSYGTVWRYDPELGKFAGRYMQLRDGYKRLGFEYYTNFRAKYWSDEARQPEMVVIDGKFGFKDNNGKVVIPPQYTHITPRWHEGVLAVSIGNEMEDTWGFIDKTGKWVIKPSFARPGFFKEGLAAVSVGKKWGFIDKRGKYVIEPQFTAVNFDGFSEGLAAVAVGDKWGYVDKKGSFIIRPQFTNAYAFSEGLAAVAVGDKWGYVDKNGNIVIPPQFDIALHFVKGVSRIRVGERWKFIDKTGGILGIDEPRPLNDVYLMDFDPDEYGRRIHVGLMRGFEQGMKRFR